MGGCSITVNRREGIMCSERCIEPFGDAPRIHSAARFLTSELSAEPGLAGDNVTLQNLWLCSLLDSGICNCRKYSHTSVNFRKDRVENVSGFFLSPTNKAKALHFLKFFSKQVHKSYSTHHMSIKHPQISTCKSKQ